MSNLKPATERLLDAIEAAIDRMAACLDKGKKISAGEELKLIGKLVDAVVALEAFDE